MSIEELTKPHIRQWIIEHEWDEPAQLMLQAHRFPDIPVREAVAQIQARQKVRHKIPSWYTQDQILFPPSLSVEQASSEESALYKTSLIKGQSMADLTGGMGVDTYFLGRNCQKAFYVEQQDVLCEVARHNFTILGVPQIEVKNGSAEDFLKTAPSLDFIYLDPARRGAENQKLYKLADCQPDITRLLPKLLEKTNTILLKAAPMLDIRQGLAELEHAKEVHAVAVKNEVKELLFLIEKGFSGEPSIIAINLQAEMETPFEFTLSEEQLAEAPLSEPLEYLYEPHAALLKAGAFKLLAQHYQLGKLHPNSHLYTSSTYIDNFPGRAFKVLFSGKPEKKAIQQFFSEGKALISSRNHPLSVQQLANKLKLKEGGTRYLFATTGPSAKPLIVIGEKVKET